MKPENGRGSVSSADQPPAFQLPIEARGRVGVASRTRRRGDDPKCVLITIDPNLDHIEHMA